jgi:hypothetical protein
VGELGLILGTWHTNRKGTLRIINAWVRVYRPTAATHLANRMGRDGCVSARIQGGRCSVRHGQLSGWARDCRLGIAVHENTGTAGAQCQRVPVVCLIANGSGTGRTFRKQTAGLYCNDMCQGKCPWNGVEKQSQRNAAEMQPRISRHRFARQPMHGDKRGIRAIGLFLRRNAQKRDRSGSA